MALGHSFLAKAFLPSLSSEATSLPRGLLEVVPVRKSPVMEPCSEIRGRRDFVRRTPRIKPKISKKAPPAASCHPRKRTFDSLLVVRLGAAWTFPVGLMEGNVFSCCKNLAAFASN